MSPGGDATSGTMIPEMIDRPPTAGGLQLSLSLDLSARIKAEAAKRGETARRLLVDILDLAFAPGPASLVDAILDREPN